MLLFQQNILMFKELFFICKSEKLQNSNSERLFLFCFSITLFPYKSISNFFFFCFGLTLTSFFFSLLTKSYSNQKIKIDINLYHCIHFILFFNCYYDALVQCIFHIQLHLCSIHQALTLNQLIQLISFWHKLCKPVRFKDGSILNYNNLD